MLQCLRTSVSPRRRGGCTLVGRNTFVKKKIESSLIRKAKVIETQNLPTRNGSVESLSNAQRQRIQHEFLYSSLTCYEDSIPPDILGALDIIWIKFSCFRKSSLGWDISPTEFTYTLLGRSQNLKPKTYQMEDSSWQFIPILAKTSAIVYKYEEIRINTCFCTKSVKNLF